MLEIDNSNIRYILFDEPDGPVYTIRKSDVLMISYPSGRREIFSASTPAYGYSPYREPVADLAPGMKYRELKHLYDYREYDSRYGDRWNPALMGVCSWIIPGLGQLIAGEVGRGFAWLGGSVGCYVLMGIGTGLAASSYVYDANGEYYESSSAGAGTALIVASVLGLIAVDICAIVDACRVAKVKNMYNEDLYRHKYSFDLHPSVNYIRSAKGMQPAAGLTFAMKF